MKRSVWTAVLSAMGMCVLILDAKTALSGAAEGLTLCVQVVIPSLLPFFVLTMLLTSSLCGTSVPLLRPVGRLCNIPVGGESLLLVGFLGGYPVGAQCVAQTYRDGQLSRQTAQRLLPICSNAGPAFLFGIVAQKFTQGWAAWVLWAIHILSALITAMLQPGQDRESAALLRSEPISLQTALRRSIRVMAEVSGWIVLFRILLCFLNRWFLWLLPDEIQIAVAGLMELSNGCCELERIECTGLRMVIASAMLAFGGLCVTMQTMTVSAPLGLKEYMTGKLIQTVCSILLSFFAQMLLFPAEDQLALPGAVMAIAPVILALFAVICRESEKKSRNPGMIGV